MPGRTIPSNEVNLSNRIKLKLLDLTYQKMTSALTSTLLVLSVLFPIIAYTSGWSVLLPWIAAFTLLLSSRAISLVHYNKNKKHSSSFAYATKAYFWGVALTGLLWASMVIWLLPALDLNGSILLCIVVSGMASGAIPSMGYQLQAIRAFILLLTTSLIYTAFAMSVPNAYGISLSLFVYALFLFRTANSFHDSVKEMLVLQEEAIDREHEIQSQKESAQQANNAKSEFLSRVSHELRTPLNAVTCFTDLLQLDTVDVLTEKQLLRTNKIKSASEHLLNLVDDILNLSRIETGDLKIKIEAVNSRMLVNNILSLVHSKMQTMALSSQIEISEEANWVMADAVRLKQVLFNLIDNAIKYNQKGGSISVVIAMTDYSHVRIAIIDTGLGLSKENQEKLFVPFSRLDATSSGIEGTGIGLSYSKQLVELMHGKIGVDSKQGQGSCFWFELPVADARTVRDKVATPDDTDSFVQMPAHHSLPDKKVLLAEDNKVNQEVAVDILEHLGYTVDIVNNGVAAIDACSSREYALIFMDCEMPIMDGLEATKNIRQQETEHHKTRIPIVALTAHAISGAREDCLNAGMDDFLSKPYSLSDIQLILSKWSLFREQKNNSADDDTRNNNASPPFTETSQFTQSAQPSAQLSNQAIIDQAVINRLRQTNKKSLAQGKKGEKKASLLNRVADIYLYQTPDLINKMEQANIDTEYTIVADIAHTLKSSSAAIGALGLSDLCCELEASVKQNHSSETEIKQKINDIRDYFQKVEKEINIILSLENET